MIVVSNTSPLHYLILIEAEHVLPELYGRVIIPTEVLRELQSEKAPERLRTWIESSPAWLDVLDAPPHEPVVRIHAGEVSAIALAVKIQAGLILMDDRDGRTYAEEQGLQVTGVLGVLRDAAQQKMVDFEAAIERLRETNFRAPQSLLDELLEHYRRS